MAEVEKQFTRLDAAVAALKRAQVKLKGYRASVLKMACEGRLVPTEAKLAEAEKRSYETGEQLLARVCTNGERAGRPSRSQRQISGEILEKLASGARVSKSRLNQS